MTTMINVYIYSTYLITLLIYNMQLFILHSMCRYSIGIAALPQWYTSSLA